MTNTISCESCNQNVDPNKVKVYNKTIKPGIQARYWGCPKCKHRTPIIVMDKVSRRMMEDNRKDRDKIGGINRNSQMLRSRNKFTSEQAQDALSRMEVIEDRINKRTKELDERSQSLIDEHQEAL